VHRHIEDLEISMKQGILDVVSDSVPTRHRDFTIHHIWQVQLAQELFKTGLDEIPEK
jgi:hypothetical protein